TRHARGRARPSRCRSTGAISRLRCARTASRCARCRGISPSAASIAGVTSTRRGPRSASQRSARWGCRAEPGRVGDLDLDRQYGGVPASRPVVSRKRWLVAIAGLVVLAGLAASAAHGKGIGDIPAGTGYAALDLCSRTMLSQEPAAQVQTLYVEPKAQPLPMFWRVEIAPGQRVTVRTWLPFLGHPRT